MATIDLKIPLLPKQQILMTMIAEGKYRRIGYGGARGGAKSHAVRELALYFGFHPKWKLQTMVFRRYKKELMNNHINPMLKAHPWLRSLFNAHDNILYGFDGNPLIHFGYADSDKDIHDFQGVEYDVIFIDEATHCTPYMLDFLTTSNRTTRDDLKGFVAKTVFTMNPGGTSHAHIKRIFVDKQYNDNENQDDFFFIQASVWDNAHWVRNQLHRDNVTFDQYYNDWTEEQRKKYTLNNADYAQNLKTLSDEMREAYLYGDWEIFGGQFFKSWNYRRQVIDPFVIPNEGSWKVYGSLDPGYSAPCSFGLTARSPEGNYFRVCSYYEEQRSPEEHAAAIREFLESPLVQYLIDGRKPEEIEIVAGRDAFVKREKYSVEASDVTWEDIFLGYGLALNRPIVDRIAGWWAWKNLFPKTINDKNICQYYIFGEMLDDQIRLINSKVKKGKSVDLYPINSHIQLNNDLINEIRNAESDDNKVEDIMGKGNDSTVSDHALDEQRYCIMYAERGHSAQTKFKRKARESGGELRLVTAEF